MPPKAQAKPEPNVTVPDGDAGLGRDIFEQHCSACHSIEGDDKNASAPSMSGIVGRAAGTSNFKLYSSSMKKSGINWTDKHIFMFIKSPAKYVSGTRMSFAGLDSEEERGHLIAYLKSL